MNHKECPDYEYCSSNPCGNDISKCCVECELNGTYCFEICDLAYRIIGGEIKSNIHRLEFQNPIFHEGQNMTVRLSRHWMRRKFAVITVNGTDQYVRIECKKWNNFNDMIRYRGYTALHDSSVKSISDLLNLLHRYYPEFCENKPVYTITFNIEKEWLQ